MCVLRQREPILHVCPVLLSAWVLQLAQRVSTIGSPSMPKVRREPRRPCHRLTISGLGRVVTRESPFHIPVRQCQLPVTTGQCASASARGQTRTRPGPGEEVLPTSRFGSVKPPVFQCQFNVSKCTYGVRSTLRILGKRLAQPMEVKPLLSHEHAANSILRTCLVRRRQTMDILRKFSSCSSLPPPSARGPLCSEVRHDRRCPIPCTTRTYNPAWPTCNGTI